MKCLNCDSDSKVYIKFKTSTGFLFKIYFCVFHYHIFRKFMNTNGKIRIQEIFGGMRL